jgi:hypothetical protein
MNYTSVPQIFEVIDETRGKIYRLVEGLSDERATARPAPNVWTALEIIEHLALIEGRLVQMMSMMLTKAEGAGAGKKDAPVEIEPFSLDEFIERSRNEKYTAPEAVRPSGKVSLADALAQLRSSRQQLHDLRPRIETTDLSNFTYPHPAFGPINFYRWLAFIGIHEERHLHQARKLLSS